MPTGAKLEKKNAYMAKLVQLVENTSVTLIVGVDNVGSRVLQKIRIAMRGKATLLMGKNTMIRTALRNRIAEKEEGSEEAEALQNLLDNVGGNRGFIFCHTADAMEVAQDVIENNKVPAMAKAGTIAPLDVFIPAGPSGLEPAQTSFFQALNINTKIVKGMIELVSEVHLINKGEKVSLSAQALLAKMGRKPFEYGMTVDFVYQDGVVFDSAVLKITDDVLIGKFMNGVSHVAAFGREIGIPTECGLPHMIVSAFKNIVALTVDIDFSAGEKADEIKNILKDPEALAKMQAAASAGAAAGGAAGGAAEEAAPAAAAAVEEEEEEEMEFDLF